MFRWQKLRVSFIYSTFATETTFKTYTMFSNQIIDKLAAYRTPFYLYDVELLHRTL